MPTIKQLPTANSVSAADVVPVSQGGVTRSLSVGGLLSNTQAAIALVPGKLLGRASASAGGPEPVSLGAGLTLQGGVVSATGEDHARLPVAASLAAVDDVVVNGGGVARRLSAGLLRGLFNAGAGVSIGADGTISSPLPTASNAALGGVKVGDGLAVGGDGTLSAPNTPRTSAAGATGGRMAVSLLHEQSAWPITAEGFLWANSPYSYLGVSKDFVAGVGGTAVAAGPVATLFAFANASGSSSDVVAVLGSAVARTSGSTVFGGNLIARSDAGVSAKLCGLEIDLVPSGAGALPGSIGLAINAFSQAMSAPAIQLGSLGGGSFDNGLVITAVRYAGVCAQVGSSMTSLVNTSTGTYSDAAVVLGNRQRIRLQGSGAGSAYIGTDGNKFMTVVPPENGFVVRDPGDVANLVLVTASGDMQVSGAGSFGGGLSAGSVSCAGAVRGATVSASAGFAAPSGAAMASLLNASGGTYSDAAVVLGNQQRVRLQGSGPGSAFIGTDGNKFMTVVPPENGVVFRDTSDTANLVLLNQYAMTVNVGLNMANTKAMVLAGPGANNAASIVHGADGYLAVSYGPNGLVFKTQGGSFQGTLDPYGTLTMVGSMNAGYSVSAGTTLGVKAMAAPASPPAGQFYVFMDQADGKLKAKGPGGTVTVLAAS